MQMQMQMQMYSKIEINRVIEYDTREKPTAFVTER